MHAYRFRVQSNDQVKFLRDIDILANQTFEDFHLTFIALFGLKSDELASFYICDYKWRKMKELTLIDMSHEEIYQEIDDDDDDLQQSKKRLSVSVMSQVKIKEMIDDPHQRLMYEYDFLNPVIFYIELIKIVPANNEKSYPLCVRSEGDFLRTPIRKTFVMENLDEDLLTTEDDLLDDTFEVDNDDVTIEEPPLW